MIFGVAFFIAQGAAVFLTALAFARFTRAVRWSAKIGWMALSYCVWVTFTWALFGLVLKPDVYLIPFMGTVTALFSSFIYLLAWVFAPLMKAKTHG
ncbi:MAG TPA: hypothetical protein VNT42_10925 [Sphingomonas sp.]|nr:hypothetical protein [Sphingomonas sp.]